jgi:hypothetical protein
LPALEDRLMASIDERLSTPTNGAMSARAKSEDNQ